MNQNLIREFNSQDEEYLRDESKNVGFAQSISFPETEAQVQDILTHMPASSVPVTVQGNRTGLAAAAVPYGGHVLNLSRMDKINGMRWDGDNFYVTVQPGVILQKLNKAIAARAFDTTNWSEESKEAYQAFTKAPVQMFTPDPTETTASIGGMVACNASGARSYRYGATRGHVTAVRGVLSSGQTIALRRGQVFARGRSIELETEQGGRISALLPSYKMPNCKNASGYFCHENMDAIDLFIGSDGTLAVLTEIELALQPAPLIVWGVTCFFPEESNAAAYTERVKELKGEFASIEYFDACALDILRKQKDNSTAFAALPYLPPSFGCAVYTELHCNDENQAYTLLEQLNKCCEKGGGTPEQTWVATSDSDRDVLHFFRHAVPESVNMQVERYKREYPDITKIGGDFAVPDEKFRDMLGVYNVTLSREGLQHAAWGHIGDNHIHVNVLPRNMEEYAKGKALLSEWAKEASAMGGAVSAEHGVGKMKASFLEIMYGKEHIKEMVELKETFDPKWILGRGNLFQPKQEVNQ